MNYSWVDAWGVLMAIALIALSFAPLGYLVSHAANVLSFRERSTSERLALIVVVGVSLLPLAQYWAGRFVHPFAGLYLPMAFPVPALVLFAQQRRVRRAGASHNTRIDRIAIALIIALPLSTVWRLIDLDQGQILLSMHAFDYPGHTQVVDALTRTGIPPQNPAFHPQGPTPLFYYYFFFLHGAVADWLGGGAVSPRHAAAAASRWVAIALGAMACLVVYEIGSQPDRLRRLRQRAVAGLLLVTGADILGVLIYGVGGGAWPRDSDLWNELISSWMNSTTYNPHHVGALVSWVLASVLLLRLGKGGLAARVAGVLVAAWAIASAVGMSIYVSIVGAVATSVWTFLAAVPSRPRRLRDPMLAAGISAVLILPFIMDLTEARQDARFPLGWGVRRFFLLDGRIEDLGLGDTWLAVGRVLALPINYLLELGVFAIGAVLYFWRRRHRPRSDVDLWLLSWIGVSVGICSFVRSTLVNNDLGWRGLLPAQFAALICTAWILTPIVLKTKATSRRRRFGSKEVLLTFLFLGLAGSVYDVVISPVRSLRSSAARLERSDGMRVRMVRDGYEVVVRCTAVEAIIQPSPTPDASIRYLQPLYGHRQVAVGTEEYGTQYGIARDRYKPFQSDVANLFSVYSKGFSALDLTDLYGIDYFIATDLDPIWQVGDSWLRKRTVFSNSSFALVAASSEVRNETCDRCPELPACREDAADGDAR